MPCWLGLGLRGWASSAEAEEAGDAGAVVASLRSFIVGGGGEVGGGGGGDAMVVVDVVVWMGWEFGILCGR